MSYPSYLNLSQKELEQRVAAAWERLDPCRVCPRECGVRRTESSEVPRSPPLADEVGTKEGGVNRKLKRQNAKYQMGELGFCRVGSEAIISSAHPHFGEEQCLVGKFGSGTIFFTSCNLACVYCQNFEISQLRIGNVVKPEKLAQIMLNLQAQGCHNLNLVSPTIYVPQILKSLLLAIPRGFNLPLVYNTGGYDHVETLKILDGIIDIYMPDIKYSDNKVAQKYSLVSDYWGKAKLAIREMHRQVGDLVIDEKTGLAIKGLLVRHLILPNNIAETKKVMGFLAQKISPNTYVNIMDQYYPHHKAHLYPALNRRITAEEYQQALHVAIAVGLHQFDKHQRIF